MKHTPSNVPIVVPCFGRPEFFKQCLDHLQRCDRIEDFTVCFCFDARQKDLKESREVLSLCEAWSASESIIFERTDVVYGSINSTGAWKYVSENTDYKDGFIYIEEDIIVSKHFLNYCLDSLNFYDENPYAMMICGYKMGKPWNAKDEKVASINRVCINPKMLGFASWGNRWKYINEHIKHYCTSDRTFLREELKKSKVDHTQNLVRRWMRDGIPVNKAGGGLIYASILLDGRYCLYPDLSLTSHIGWYGWHILKNPRNQAKCVNRIENFDRDLDYSRDFPIVDKKYVSQSINIDAQFIQDPNPL